VADEGDEFINTADQVGMVVGPLVVGGSSVWVLRPFAPRVIAQSFVKCTGAQQFSQPPFVEVGGFSLPFRKSHDDTTLIVSGAITGWINTVGTGMWIAPGVPGRFVPAGGVPPANKSDYSWHFLTSVTSGAKHHETFPFNYTGTLGLPKGDHVMKLYVGVTSNSFMRDEWDGLHMTIREAYPAP
jgi:hypothetical protein